MTSEKLAKEIEKEVDKENYRTIKKSEILIDYSNYKIKDIKKENWSIGLIIDFLIKNKIILFKK